MRFTLILLFIVIHEISHAQLYKTTMGVRLDDAQIGMSFTQRLLPKTTATSYFDLEANNLQVGVAVRHHFKIAGRRLNWYPSGGVHWGTMKGVGSFSGINPGMGAEYKFILAPVVISFDMIPSVHLFGNHPDWWTFNTVFSIRYILVKDKKIRRPNRKESDDK